MAAQRGISVAIHAEGRDRGDEGMERGPQEAMCNEIAPGVEMRMIDSE